ncbi:M48 family metalloprotease [uncultured Cohaesibacter sp.]|uniref:M48 family metalloprotease n=1 Tax=uncultured Cohaesibacter sp. TaxID=1002546 RepID=UPI0029C878E1|nr:M48 family metalloprotease [uncultured Cohaesibacter sp.]
MVAFLSLGAACFVALALSMIWALDMARGAGSLYAQFSFLINGANPLLLLPWLSKAIPVFEQARGNSVFDPSAWHLLLFMCCLLFAAHICRFDKPRGESLLLYPAARPVAEHLLQSLGYFVDIRMPMGRNGAAETDFFGSDALFFAPRGHLGRILKGKRSDGLQRRLAFFMVHECAHAVTRDNLANSAFVVVVALLSFMVFMIFGPLILFGSTMLSMTPAGPKLTLPLSIFIFVLFCGGIHLCFRGLVVCYIKAREFFADQAAFRFVADVDAPYGFTDMPPEPDSLSALRTGISPHERALHQQGFSLHARDMLIYFWGIVFSIRTLYVLVAPKDLCWTVLVFDAVALGAFGGFYFTLPKRPPTTRRRGRLAWLLTFLAVLAVEVCGPGLVGSVMMFYRGIFSNFNAQLIGMPGLILLLVFLIGGIVKAIRGLLSGRLGSRWYKRVPVRRLALSFVSLPGSAAGFLMIVLTGVVFCIIPLNYFLRFGLFHTGWLATWIVLLVMAAGTLLLFHQYLLLFVRRRSLIVAVGAVELALVMLFSCTLAIGQADVMDGVRQGVVHSIPGLDRLPGLFAGADWSEVLPFAAISTSFYLVLRLLSFWAQDTLGKMDLRLARESSR